MSEQNINSNNTQSLSNNNVPVPHRFESLVFARHDDASDPDGVPADARLAISQAERHLAQCDGIPDRLRAVLLAAETNCRVNGGVVLPCVKIDQAADCIPIPPNVPIIDFVLQCLSSYAKDRADAIITVNDELRVLHLSTSDSYQCSCSIERDDTAVTLGRGRSGPFNKQILSAKISHVHAEAAKSTSGAACGTRLRRDLSPKMNSHSS